MPEKVRWTTHRIKCPEQKDESSLLAEWREKNGKEVLNSISCDNIQLKDLSGSDCHWTCWEKIAQGK